MNRFTSAVLKWRPRIDPVDLESASDAQMHALEVSGKLASKSDYFRVLVHDPDSLVHRSVLYDSVMYSESGLGRVERELASLIVSMANGCRYCVSVHSRRLGQLAEDKPGVEAILRGEEGLLEQPRLAAIARVSANLTKIPAKLTPADIDDLRAQGLRDLEIFDLVNVIAMFAWANRLMQSLGDSVDPKSAPGPVDSGSSTIRTPL